MHYPVIKGNFRNFTQNVWKVFLQTELRTANRNFRYRSDQANLAKLNDAKVKYNEAYSKASTRWWSKTLEKIDRKNLWKVVNKIKNSHTHIAVQPIRTANDEYVFQDEEIAAKLEEVGTTIDFFVLILFSW